MIQIEYLSIFISIIIIVYLLLSLNEKLIKSISIINYKIRKYTIKRKLASAFEKQEVAKFRLMLFENALLKIRSTDKNEKIMGLEELAQLSDGKNYKSLIIALKNEEDEQNQKYLINILCRIINEKI